MKRIKGKGIQVVIYEPVLKESIFFGPQVTNNLSEFKKLPDIIVTNRITSNLGDVLDKIYTRDLFGGDS
jgi:UDPglucose 6-dehydrogenase